MSKRLDKEVWALDRCSGCGSCVALCSKGMLAWGADESPYLQRREKALGLSHTTLDSCSFCQKFCEAVCPRLVDTWETLDPRQVLSVRTRGLVQSGEPADVIKHLLVAALAGNLVEGAILEDMDPWTLQPVARVATSAGEVIDSLGMSYLWAPALSALNEAIFELGIESLAVAATPCVSQGIDRLRTAENERLGAYRRALRLNIAAFCTGVYRPELIDDLLAGKLGIPRASIRRLVASPRDNRLTAVMWDGSIRDVPLSQADGYTRHGCARCDDYLGESADLAVGSAGAPEGFATVIVRSLAGEICLRAALDLRLLEIGGEVDATVLRRAREEKERRQRAQAFDRLMVMMLDALGEPRRRAEVKQAFDRLYGTRRTVDARREEANCVTCSQC